MVKNPSHEMAIFLVPSMLFIRLLLYVLASCLISEGDRSSQTTIVSVDFEVVDEAGKSTAVRVRVTDLEGHYYAPLGHSADFPLTFSRDQEAMEQDVMLADDRRFAYVAGSFTIELAVDQKYRVEIVKGFNYQIISDTFHVDQKTAMQSYRLTPTFDLPHEGWYSGDVHVHHINAQSALLEMKAEDLNVCNILISDFTLDHDQYRGQIEPISDDKHLIFLGQEYREDRLGHVNLLNITKGLVQPAKVMRPYQYPLNLAISDVVRNQGGHISWAHFAAWPGLEGPLGLVLKKVDAIELLCTIDPFQSPIFISEVVPELPLHSGLRLWYRLLNCGLQVPITAGTDKMGNLVTVGANRVYAKLEGEFNYPNWVKVLTQGHTFVSNNPFLQFEVNGQEVGAQIQIAAGDSVYLRAQVWSQFQVDVLELVANGDLVASKQIEPGETHAQVVLSYVPTESVWLAARAYRQQSDYLRKGVGMSERRNLSKANTELNRYYGTLRPEVPFAHTSPVYIHLDDQPIYRKPDVDYFVQYLDNVSFWLERNGDFPTEAAKAEVLAKFAEGRSAFMALHR